MKSRIKFLVLPFVAFILMSCNLLSPGGPIRATGTPDLVQTLTALAPTGQALISTATTAATTANTQGAPSPFPSATSIPTKAANTSVPVVQITPLVPTATKTPVPVVTRCDWAQFLGDVTVPDGTQFKPGDTFIKTWRLKNIGTCNWTQNYQLIFAGGSAMGGPTSANLHASVAPGGTIDVSLTLTAPANPGTYTGNWKLANANGATFGIGGDAQSSFYVTIKVVSAPPPVVTPIRINFFSNATDANVAGSVGANQHPPQYILRVLAGQTMMVSITSPNDDFYMVIYGATTGVVLLDKSAESSSWQGIVPATQDYVIETFKRGSSTNFNLNIIIPERIAFQPGAVSASLASPLRARETHAYVLRAAAGQTMTLTLTPSDQTVLLAFYGYEDGQPYLRTVTGQTSWTGQVPATQDYIVQVVSVIDSNTTFKLDVTIQ